MVESNPQSDQSNAGETSGKKGEADSGALSKLENPLSEAIAGKAKSYVGSTDWAKAPEKGSFGKDSWKCNLFVYDVLTEAGASVPLIKRKDGSLTPPLAGEWADRNICISGFEIIPKDQAQPGDVVAEPHLHIPFFRPETGHAGIVTGPNKTTSVISHDENGQEMKPEKVGESS